MAHGILEDLLRTTTRLLGWFHDAKDTRKLIAQEHAVGRKCRDTALKDVDVLPNRMHLLLLAGDAVDLLTADC